MALIKALKNGNTEIAKHYIKLTTNFDLKDKYGYTALMIASHEGHTEMFELLLPLSDANLKSISGYTALTIASYSGQTEKVKLLLPFSDVDVKNILECMTCTLAIHWTYTDIVELLEDYIKKNSLEE